jgi:hypothetical protein
MLPESSLGASISPLRAPCSGKSEKPYDFGKPVSWGRLPDDRECSVSNKDGYRPKKAGDQRKVLSLYTIFATKISVLAEAQQTVSLRSASPRKQHIKSFELPSCFQVFDDPPPSRFRRNIAELRQLPPPPLIREAQEGRPNSLPMYPLGYLLAQACQGRARSRHYQPQRDPEKFVGPGRPISP